MIYRWIKDFTKIFVTLEFVKKFNVMHDIISYKVMEEID